MKKVLLALVVGLVPFYSFAADHDKGDGCGLGWQVTEKRTFIATTTRGTTNAVVPPTFGMTSGTIGCEQHTLAKADMPAATYAISNYDSLKQEMAEGKGEYLHGFARTLGCSDVAVDSFGKMTQKNYREIMSNDGVSMLNNVKAQIKKDAALSDLCKISA